MGANPEKREARAEPKSRGRQHLAGHETKEKCKKSNTNLAYHMHLVCSCASQ